MGAIARVLGFSVSPIEESAVADYDLLAIPSDRADEEMLIPGESSGIPEVLQGIWWMDGNPLPDELLSLGASAWDPETRTTRIQVYGERIWTWHGDVLGRLLYERARASRLVYEIRFDPDLTVGAIVPIITVLGRRLRVPALLVKLTMRRAGEGLWRRESAFFGLFHHVYALRRVVQGDGSRLPAFATYAASAPATSYVAVRRRDALAAT